MKRKQNFALQNLGGEHILVPVGEEVLNLNGILVLNRTALYLWECLAEETSEENLVENLSCEYSIGKEMASRDVKVFLDEVRSKGMIEA